MPASDLRTASMALALPLAVLGRTKATTTVVDPMRFKPSEQASGEATRTTESQPLSQCSQLTWQPGTMLTEQNLKDAAPRSNIQLVVDMSHSSVSSQAEFLQHFFSSRAIDHQGISPLDMERSVLPSASSFLGVSFHPQEKIA